MTTFEKDAYLKNLCNLLSQQRTRENLCDFVVKSGDKKFPAHRNVLVARSKYFEGMFSFDTRETQQNCVEIDQIKPDVLKDCIDFMYTGEVQLSLENSRDILHAGEYLLMEDLMQVCFAHLEDALNTKTCLRVRNMADRFRNETLLKKAEDCAQKNFGQIVSTPEFLDLEKVDILRFIKISETHPDSDPTPIWDGVMRWIKQDPEGREESFPEFVSCFIQKGIFASINITTLLNEQLLEKFSECKSEAILSILSNTNLLICRLTRENCFALHRLALAYSNLDESRNAISLIRKYMTNNIGSIYQLDEFKGLSRDAVVSILTSPDGVHISPATREGMWRAAMAWIKQDTNERKASLPSILKGICPGKLTPNYIESVVRKEPLVVESSECKDMLLDGYAAFCKRRKLESDWDRTQLNSTFGGSPRFATSSHGRTDVVATSASTSVPADGTPFGRGALYRLDPNSSKISGFRRFLRAPPTDSADYHSS